MLLTLKPPSYYSLKLVWQGFGVWALTIARSSFRHGLLFTTLLNEPKILHAGSMILPQLRP